jgi:hypothetical protein
MMKKPLRKPVYMDWFVQRIVKLNAVFRPLIQGLA